MSAKVPVPELHAGFSGEGAIPTGWAEGRRHIEDAQVFWLSTVRPDGAPTGARAGWPGLIAGARGYWRHVLGTPGT
jgi:hypothetical protein